MKVKERAEEVLTTSKRVALNADNFVQATALVALVGFSYVQLPKANLPVWGQWVITAALVIVGLRAAWEYYRFFDRK